MNIAPRMSQMMGGGAPGAPGAPGQAPPDMASLLQVGAGVANT